MKKYFVFIKDSGTMKNGPWTLEGCCPSQPLPHRRACHFVQPAGSAQTLPVHPSYWAPLVFIMDTESLKMKAACSFETIGTTLPVMQHYIPTDQDRLSHRCESNKTHNPFSLQPTTQHTGIHPLNGKGPQPLLWENNNLVYLPTKIIVIFTLKGKGFPLQAWCGSWVFQEVKAPGSSRHSALWRW